MKKFTYLLLAFVLIVAMLTSCNKTNNESTSTSSDSNTEVTDTSTNTSVNGSASTDTGTNGSTSTNTGNVNTNTNTNVNTNSGTNTSTSTTNTNNNPSDGGQNAYTAVMELNYRYGSYAELLCDSSYLVQGFDQIVFPDNLIAGDVFSFEYTGDLITLETYPGRTSLYGNVISYEFYFAEYIHLSGTEINAEKIKNEYNLLSNYVVQNKEGEYTTLDAYDGSELYLVVKQYANYDNDKINDTLPSAKTEIVCMYSYNPRKGTKAGEEIFEADFVYDHVYDKETNEPLVKLLFEDCYLNIDGVEYPSNLVAGDKLNIEYDGVIMTEESYPGHTYLYGELISYRFELADVICLENYYTEGTEFGEESYFLPSEADVILDKNGRYMSIKQFIEENPNAKVYVSFWQDKGYDFIERSTIAAIYAYNPREVE